MCSWKPDPTKQNPRGIFWNRGSFADVDSAVAAINTWDAEKETTVYFTIGAMKDHKYTGANGKEKYHRTQEKATWFKTLALDLDIGPDKPYATQKDGWDAMKVALKAIGMPMPMIVSSGNGIHLYWPLTVPVKKDIWERASIALRIALDEQGVVIDTSKIHDPSMVLRPVGSHHKKQWPWKLVECKHDTPDNDPLTLFTVLKPWAHKVVKTAPSARKSSAVSSVMTAVLNSNDVDIEKVAEHCAQIRAMVESGGVTDASGMAVLEPMWRAALGMARHAIDPEQAIIMLAGKHPDFDLQDSLDKMSRYKGTGPTTCAKFEQLCGRGCDGCAYKGKITSPAQLSSSTTATVTTDDGEELTVQLPPSYVEKDGKIYKEIKTTEESVDANGNVVTSESVEWELVSPYRMHITGVYTDEVTNESAFRLAINYPLVGWKEADHKVGVLASIGREFSTFLLNRQVFSAKAVGQQERLRSYLMDYLTLVQSQAPTGQDYVTFGWQEDGSFLCGEKVLGTPSGTTDRRLKGAANTYANIIRPHGDRSKWVDAMAMLDLPGTATLRSAVLLATTGILARAAGNGTLVVSIYSTETTTGKTLALIAANSLIGTPKALFMAKNDTANALYKIRGTLNNLPCTIDELTMMEDKAVADMAYDMSQGREKIAMNKDREIREPAVWAGPTFITTNFSLHQKFENVQTNNDPLTARTLELLQNDRTFVAPDDTGSSNGYRFFDLVAENNGFAFPELVEAVLAMGGDKEVWKKGEAAFLKKYNFIFEPQERFYRTAIVAGWILGTIGKKLGLFPFDVDGTTQYLLDHVKQFRTAAVQNKQDVFDTIGQFLQEHNDQLIEVTETYGSNKEQVRVPAPERAVARIKIVSDSNNPVMPGSQLAINMSILKKWLGKNRDAIDRLLRELATNGALISPRERVTIFKGCLNRNPGQAHCVVININHPRFIDALTGTTARAQSPVTLAVLQGGAT